MGGSVADMLSTDIGQSAHLRAVPTDRVHQVLSDLRIGPQTILDPDTLPASPSSATPTLSSPASTHASETRS